MTSKTPYTLAGFEPGSSVPEMPPEPGTIVMILKYFYLY
jgi:hypothetical protein